MVKVNLVFNLKCLQCGHNDHFLPFSSILVITYNQKTSLSLLLRKERTMLMSDITY